MDNTIIRRWKSLIEGNHRDRAHFMLICPSNLEIMYEIYETDDGTFKILKRRFKFYWGMSETVPDPMEAMKLQTIESNALELLVLHGYTPEQVVTIGSKQGYYPMWHN